MREQEPFLAEMLLDVLECKYIETHASASIFIIRDRELTGKIPIYKGGTRVATALIKEGHLVYITYKGELIAAPLYQLGKQMMEVVL